VTGRPMIDVEYTREMVEMEPGPNFHWRGTPPGYLRLLQDLHALAVAPGVEVRPRRLGYIDVLGGYEITLQSSARGNTLFRLSGRNIEVDLTCGLWRQVLQQVLSVSFYKSHCYVEFDDRTLTEEANFIISSER
jgi:hypothetical protein